MMNVIVPSKECSSGCDSGWTLYLEHSSNTTSFSNFHKTNEKIVKFEQEEEEEEEDLSMVSDASSGPPHFDHDIDEEEEEELLWYSQNTMTLSHFPDNKNIDGNVGRLRKQCMKSSYAFETQCHNKGSNDLELDDSASSHVFTSNKKIGGIHHHHVQNNQSVSFKKFINYSSQAYSTTHLQVINDNRTIRHVYRRTSIDLNLRFSGFVLFGTK